MLVPGRILVIDDLRTKKDKRKVDALLRSLRQGGESVLFDRSMPENEDVLQNVRLLIVDLFLVEGDEESSYELVASIIRKTSQKTGFLIVAIWTKYTIDPERDKKIIEELEALARIRYPRAVFLEPFGKEISPIQLIKRIKKSMASKPECGLLLETERCVEKARDYAVSDIISAASIPVILKALKEEVGDIALSRQVIGLFLKVLSRHSRSTQTMSDCIKELIAQPPSIDVDKYGLIYSLESYYEVPEEEPICTGDVLERKNKKEYAVVVTPVCDFAQRKKRPLEYIKLISAMRVNQDDFANKGLLKKIRTELKISKKKTLKESVKLILTGGLQERFYVLKCLKDDREDAIFYLILDFQRISKLRFKEKVAALGGGGWTRVCRIDTPLIENLLQEYSVYSSRIGIQSMPEDIVKALADKTKS